MAERRNFAVVAYIVLVSISGGLIVSGLWMLLAPRPDVHVVKGELLVPTLSQAYVSADMIFALLVMGMGVVVTGIAVWRWRTSSLALLIGCLAGGVIGSAIAWRLAERLTGSQNLTAVGRPEGEVFAGPLALHSHGTVYLWSIVSAALLMLVLWRQSSVLRKRLASYDQSALSVPASD